MSTLDENFWDKFWPVRAVVKAAVDAGNEVEQAVANEWQVMRNHIVAKYYYLVQRVAESMSKKIVEVEQDSLASMGVDGLYDAVDGYGSIDPATGDWAGIDPNSGKPVKFGTYAAYRIKGSIIDEIRRDDWVPRLVRARAKKLDRSAGELLVDLGRAPTEDEMAEKMGMPVEEYREHVRTSALKSMQSLNATVSGGDEDSRNGGEMSMMDCIRDPQAFEPLEAVIQEEVKSKLFSKGFTPLERRIIHSYYYEGRSMREISEAIGLSESRVSQMNTDIINRLKEKIRRNPEYFGKQVMEMLRK